MILTDKKERVGSVENVLVKLPAALHVTADFTRCFAGTKEEKRFLRSAHE